MAGKIEKMTRMRKNILWGVLITTSVAFCLNIYPTIHTLFHSNRNFISKWKYPLIEGAIALWLFTALFFLTRFWLYKKKLKREPSLHSAVYDERVRLNWLKANRIAFFVLVSSTILYERIGSIFSGQLLNLRFTLPNGPFFVLWGAIISLVGSFIYYNQEGKYE